MCSQADLEGPIVHVVSLPSPASIRSGGLTRDGQRPRFTEDCAWIPELSSVWIPELTPTLVWIPDRFKSTFAPFGRLNVSESSQVRCASPKSSHSSQESSILRCSSTAGRMEGSPSCQRKVPEYIRIFSQSPTRSGKECHVSSPELLCVPAESCEMTRHNSRGFGRVVKPSLQPRGSPLSALQRRRLGIDLHSRREEEGMLM